VKLNEVTKKTDALKGVNRENAAPIVKDLKAIMNDIDECIAVLARECLSEWSDDQTIIDSKIFLAKDKWKEGWGALGEDETEYGIGGA